MVGGENLSARLLYIQAPIREMNNVIEVSDEEQFAKFQDTRDLRVSPDPTEPGIQFIETIDTSGDFFRSLESLTREISKQSTEVL